MALKLEKLRNFFSTNQIDSAANISDLQPEVGFKLTYFEQTKQLVVKVIGARHLPSIYGTQKPEGYLIKVIILLLLLYLYENLIDMKNNLYILLYLSPNYITKRKIF